MKKLLILPALAALTACAQVQPPPPRVTVAPAPVPAPVPVEPAPQVTTTPLAPSPTARTAEEFDTTTDEERAAAIAAAEAAPPASGPLGSTVASLGDPARPGLWIETPLVGASAKGRVTNSANGKSVEVDLIPISGPKSAGSRLSLAAMRSIEAPLTELPTVEVFAN